MRVTREQWLRLAKIGAYSTIAFAALWAATNLRNAVLGALCWLAGYLIEFYVVRSILSLAQRRPLHLRNLIVAFLAIAIAVFVVASGYGLILAAACVSFLLMDLLILKFR